MALPYIIYRLLKKRNCVIIFLDKKVSNEFTQDLVLLNEKNDQYKKDV